MKATIPFLLLPCFLFSFAVTRCVAANHQNTIHCCPQLLVNGQLFHYAFYVRAADDPRSGFESHVQACPAAEGKLSASSRPVPPQCHWGTAGLLFGPTRFGNEKFL